MICPGPWAPPHVLTWCTTEAGPRLLLSGPFLRTVCSKQLWLMWLYLLVGGGRWGSRPNSAYYKNVQFPKLAACERIHDGLFANYHYIINEHAKTLKTRLSVAKSHLYFKNSITFQKIKMRRLNNEESFWKRKEFMLSGWGKRVEEDFFMFYPTHFIPLIPTAKKECSLIYLLHKLNKWKQNWCKRKQPWLEGRNQVPPPDLQEGRAARGWINHQWPMF